MPKAASLRNLRLWKPGQSGNPNGRSRAPRFTERDQHAMLQTYLEEQDQDPEFGQGVKRPGLVDEAKDAGTDEDSGQQFTEDRCLADALHRLACHLRGQPDEDEAQEQVTKLHRVFAIAGSANSRERRDPCLHLIDRPASLEGRVEANHLLSACGEPFELVRCPASGWLGRAA
jgi:hypothetical protein